MKKSHRNNGRAIKWINTRYANKYKVRQWLEQVEQARIQACYAARVRQIHGRAMSEQAQCGNKRVYIPGVSPMPPVDWYANDGPTKE